MNKLKLLIEELNIDSIFIKSKMNNNIKIIKKYFDNGKTYEDQGLNSIICKHYNIDTSILSTSTNPTRGIDCLKSFLFNGVLKKIDVQENYQLELTKLKDYYFFNSRKSDSISPENTGILLPFAVSFYEFKGKKGIFNEDNLGEIPIETYEFPSFKAISSTSSGNHRMMGISLGYALFSKCILEVKSITRYKLINNDNNFTKKAVALLKSWNSKIDLFFKIEGNKFEFTRYNQKITVELQGHPLANKSIFKILKNLTSWFSFMNAYNISFIKLSEYCKNKFNLNIKNESFSICEKSLVKFANLPFFVDKMNKYYRTQNSINLFKMMIRKKKALRKNKNAPRYILHYLDSYLIRNFTVLFWRKILSNLKMKAA